MIRYKGINMFGNAHCFNIDASKVFLYRSHRAKIIEVYKTKIIEKIL